MNRCTSTPYVAALTIVLFTGGVAAKDKAKKAVPARELLAYRTICGSAQRPSDVATDAKTEGGRFDPACYVQIFEDPGNNKRVVLHSPSHPAVTTRLLQVDTESKIIIDLERGLTENQDLALNKFYVTAALTKANSTKPIQVTGYSEIGKSADDTQAQKAFAFATFNDLAGKLMNLYYTTKDILVRLNGGSDECFNAAMKAGTPAMTESASVCHLNDYADNPQDKLTGTENSLVSALKVYGPEAQTLTAFFSDNTNRLVNAIVARRIFDIDIDSLQAIAKQIKTNMDAVAQQNTTLAGKQDALYQIYYRLLLIANDLSYLHSEMLRLRHVAVDKTAAAPGGELSKLCPHTLSDPPAFTARLDEKYDSAHAGNFAEACFIESEKTKYVLELERYLVNGTISLPDNSVADGDIITLTVEARGPDGNSLGAPAEFRIRATNYGIKAAVRDSVFFIKRIGVNEADANRPTGDPVHGLTPVRFSPYPGVSLVATFFSRGDRSCPECQGDHRTEYRLPGFGTGAKVAHALAPGLGVNVTFMSFKDPRDFNAATGTFTNTTGNTFEMGVGPVVSLFNHRVSAAYGFDLMAPTRRTYWALGFSFIDFAKDLSNFFKSK